MAANEHSDSSATDNSGPPLPVRPLRADLLLMLLLTTATTVALSLVQAPIEIWPLALVALAPWTVAVCRVQRPWVIHWGSYLLGSLYFLVNLKWLMPVTGLGYVALAFYLGLYWPLAAWAIRTGRRARITPALSLPVVWVACEYLRGWVMTGFPWLFVAHAFYRQVVLIQVADLVGAYGVTFLAVMVSGTIAVWVLRFWPGPQAGDRPRRATAVTATLVTLALLVGNYLYGRYRMGQEQFVDGPRVAVIQEDFPLSSTPPYSENRMVVFARHMALAAAAMQEKPDVVLFPETAWSSIQNHEFVERAREIAPDMPMDAWTYGKLCHEATAAFARGDYSAVNRVIARFENDLNRGQPGAGRIELPRLPAAAGPPVTVVLGVVAVETSPAEVYPRLKRFNSVVVYNPDGTQRRERYDKIHLVPFGEFVPFRNARVLGFDLHWLYRLLNSLSPFSEGGTVEYSLWRGDELTAFPLTAGGRLWHFGTPICYEDTVASLIRDYTWAGGKRRVDFLLNVSNDGWFQHSEELAQHLAICVFRAVESRVGIARAVNTGISGFIDPAGRLYSLVERDGQTTGPGITGYRVDAVKVDRRRPAYARTGDWFAITCVVLTALLWGGAIVTRWILAAERHLIERFARRKKTSKP